MPLIVHPEARRLIESHYPPGAVNAARLRMAHMPEGAELLLNPISRAPGFRIGNVFVLAGVPQVMQATFSELKHRLRGGPRMLSRSVSCGLGEGTIAADERVRYSRRVAAADANDADAAAAGRRGNGDDGICGREHARRQYPATGDRLLH